MLILPLPDTLRVHPRGYPAHEASSFSHFCFRVRSVCSKTLESPCRHSKQTDYHSSFNLIQILKRKDNEKLISWSLYMWIIIMKSIWDAPQRRFVAYYRQPSAGWFQDEPFMCDDIKCIVCNFLVGEKRFNDKIAFG